MTFRTNENATAGQPRHPLLSVRALGIRHEHASHAPAATGGALLGLCLGAIFGGPVGAALGAVIGAAMAVAVIEQAAAFDPASYGRRRNHRARR
jgi:outer membrane lipoprotein SlyB